MGEGVVYYIVSERQRIMSKLSQCQKYMSVWGGVGVQYIIQIFQVSNSQQVATVLLALTIPTPNSKIQLKWLTRPALLSFSSSPLEHLTRWSRRLSSWGTSPLSPSVCGSQLKQKLKIKKKIDSEYSVSVLARTAYQPQCNINSVNSLTCSDPPSPYFQIHVICAIKLCQFNL